jgi:hypothetical protein
MQNGIAGRWRSTTDSPCSQRYPRELEFDPRGIYTARSDGGFTLWDSGGWAMEGADQVRITTANDAEISYPFRVSGDRLAFRDPEGCEFEYQRIG